VINQELEPLNRFATMKVFIADDTLYRRNQSKHLDLLAHTMHPIKLI
jgi:hypothetical protein